jgi:chemotaxis protein MotB
MSRSRRGRGHAAHENEERWLLTYADMITLLMALFMVLFSISSVNISKYQTLQESLHAAFSGSVLPGGQALKSAGATASRVVLPSSTPSQAILPPAPTVALSKSNSVTPHTPTLGTPKGTTHHQAVQHAAQVEQSQFVALKARLEAYARAHGFAGDVKVTIVPQGLVVQVLTDRLLFDSGSAALNPAGLPLLAEIGNLLNLVGNPVNITGYTDSVPTDTPQFPSNLWLSSGRADTVEGFLTSHGLDSSRVWAIGRGALDPVASNATDSGRALNRRVVIELVRTGAAPTATPTAQKGRTS